MNRVKMVLMLAAINLVFSSMPLTLSSREGEKSGMGMKQVKALIAKSRFVPTHLAFSPDGKNLAVGLSGGILIWETSSWQVAGKIYENSSYPEDFEFSSDGKEIVVVSSSNGGRSGEIALYALATGKKARVLLENIIPTTRVVFSPDRKFFTFASCERADTPGGCSVKIYNISTNKMIRKMAPHSNVIYAIAFSSDQKLLATGSGDGSLRLWDFSTGNLIRVFQGKALPKGMAHQGWVGHVSFSPDGKRLASGDSRSESTIKLWDVRTGEELHKKLLSVDPVDQIQGLAFSPNGELLAASSMRKITVIDVSTWKEVWSLAKGEEEGGFAHAAFSPNGKWFAFVSYPYRGEDQRIEIWKLAKP
jgi:WD40 repeat protein